METGSPPHPPSPPDEPGRAPHAQPAAPRSTGSSKATWFLLGAGAGCLGALTVAALVALPVVFLLRLRSPPVPYGPPPPSVYAVPAPGPSIGPVTGQSSTSPPAGDFLTSDLPGAQHITEAEYGPGIAQTPSSTAFHEALFRYAFEQRGAQAEGDIGHVTKLAYFGDGSEPQPAGGVCRFVLSNAVGQEVTIHILYRPDGSGGWTFSLAAYEGP